MKTNKILHTIMLFVLFFCSTTLLAKDHDVEPNFDIFGLIENANLAILKNPFGNFFDYKPEGACLWVDWDWTGPDFNITPYVRHYWPDALISVFHRYGTNPFNTTPFNDGNYIDVAQKFIGDKESRIAFHHESEAGDSGSRQGEALDRFFEVDVIGNPVIHQLTGIFLPTIRSVAEPFKPYYSSLSDVYLWRSPVSEIISHPTDILPFTRIEGSKLSPWGNIFPRFGTVPQFSQYKAAAVIALRAADIATNSRQAHFYFDLQSGNCGWPECTISASHENDNESVKYQRIYPDATTDFDPDDFGKNDSFNVLSAPYGSEYTKKGGNNYAWLMWRKYEGCIKGRGDLIYAWRY